MQNTIIFLLYLQCNHTIYLCYEYTNDTQTVVPNSFIVSIIFPLSFGFCLVFRFLLLLRDRANDWSCWWFQIERLLVMKQGPEKSSTILGGNWLMASENGSPEPLIFSKLEWPKSQAFVFQTFEKLESFSYFSSLKASSVDLTYRLISLSESWSSELSIRQSILNLSEPWVFKHNPANTIPTSMYSCWFSIYFDEINLIESIHHQQSPSFFIPQVNRYRKTEQSS